MEKNTSCPLKPIQVTRVGYQVTPFPQGAPVECTAVSPLPDETKCDPTGQRLQDAVAPGCKEMKTSTHAAEEKGTVLQHGEEQEMVTPVIEKSDAVISVHEEKETAHPVLEESKANPIVPKQRKVIPRVSGEPETTLLKPNVLPGDLLLQSFEQTISNLIDSYRNFLALGFCKPTYVCSSLFLLECHEYLTEDEWEKLHFVTGTQVMNLRVMHLLKEIEMKNRSVVHAASDLRSSARELIRMDEYGHSLLGIFHSQPGRGKGSVMPSAIDMATQERFERGGYPVISAIFNREGFVRFFSHRLNFEVTIYGKGVDYYGDNTFKITD